LSMDRALKRLTIKSNMITAKGKAVINVILCKACRPPAFRSINASVASKIPQPAVCHLGGIGALVVAMQFITNVPEYADHRKKMMLMTNNRKQASTVNGRYSRKRNNNAWGSVASRVNDPLAI